ncbi:MAG: hypothetical protein IJV07_01735 [Alphaproteobacteria bacterium]|nr:hypothetical protein [Alphaproteobacteria bacterium]
MNKKAICGIMLIGLCLGIKGKTQTSPALDTILSHISQGMEIPREVIKTADREKNPLMNQIDIVLNQLLTMPTELRPYVFPGLFDIPGVPKKIRTHPDIAVWEGKMPTDIPPAVRAYADEYLKDMNPQMYIYLIPGLYHQEMPGRDLPVHEAGIGSGQAIDKVGLLPKIVGNPDEYLSVEEVFKQPDFLIQNPDAGVLSERDISRMGAGLSAFNQFINQRSSDDPLFQTGYQALTNFYTDRHQERVTPFSEKLKRVRLLDRTDDLEKAMKQAGWDSPEQFAAAADTMAKAYRAARMPMRVAFEARRYRGHIPKSEIETMMVTQARLYEATPADVWLVLKNLNQVREAFIKTGYQSVLNAETVDEIRN